MLEGIAHPTQGRVRSAGQHHGRRDGAISYSPSAESKNLRSAVVSDDEAPNRLLHFCRPLCRFSILYFLVLTFYFLSICTSFYLAMFWPLLSLLRLGKAYSQEERSHNGLENIVIQTSEKTHSLLITVKGAQRRATRKNHMSNSSSS